MTSGIGSNLLPLALVVVMIIIVAVLAFRRR